MIRLFDSHSHLNADAFDSDRDAVVERMKAAGMAGALVVACNDEDLERVKALVARYPGFLFGAWAVHPEYPDHREPDVEEIARTASLPGFVAVGETGLDYYWCKEPLDWQRERFARHVAAAKLADKPLVIHARDAEGDALRLLERAGAPARGFVMHCFCGSLDDAMRAVEMGGFVSFTGNLTFKRNEALRDIVRAIPLQNLLVETDCPYMAPVPHRGKRCEPVHVREICQTMADVKGLTLEATAGALLRNTERFFGLNLESTRP